jgi:hypothetical protein
LPSRLISRLTFAARGNLPQHSPQLLGALDGLPVQLQHHVIDLQTDLPGGSVVIDQRDHRAADLFELERLRLLLVNVGQVHAQVALRGGVQQQQRSGLLEKLRKLPRLRRSDGRRHGQPRSESHEYDES